LKIESNDNFFCENGEVKTHIQIRTLLNKCQPYFWYIDLDFLNNQNFGKCLLRKKNKKLFYMAINATYMMYKILQWFYFLYIVFFLEKKNLSCTNYRLKFVNHLDGGPVVKAWNQEVCSICGFRFEPCGCSYDGHWRLTWSLTSGPMGLVEVRASWPGHPR